MSDIFACISFFVLMIFLYATRHFLLFINSTFSKFNRLFVWGFLFFFIYILLASNYENNFIIFCFGSPFLIRTSITKNYMNR